MSETYTCEACGKRIAGEHLMTVRSSWLKAGGHGEAPPSAIVHVCDEKCAKKSPEFRD